MNINYFRSVFHVRLNGWLREMFQKCFISAILDSTPYKFLKN